MLEQQDLQAIAQLMEQSEKRMKEYVGTTVNTAVAQSEKRMKEYVGTAVAQSENRIKTYIEQTSERDIKILAEGHHDLSLRLPAAEEQEQLKSRVSVLEHIAKGMRTELDALERAQ